MKLRLLFVATAMALMAACSTIGSVGPNEQIGAGVEAVTAVRTTADSLLVSHKITKADAQNIQNQADTIVALLQTLRTLPPSTDITSRINQALALLAALQGYLVSKGTS